MMGNGDKRRAVNCRPAPGIITLILLVLFVLFFTGCEAGEEASYQEQVGSLRDRYSDIADRSQALGTEFEEKAKALEAAGGTDLNEVMSKVNALIDEFTARYQQLIAEVQQLQTEFQNIKPPKEYETAHSIYNNGMSTVVVSLNESMRGLGLLRNYQSMDNALIVLENSWQFLEKGEESIRKADDIVFGVDEELIITIVLGVLLLVGLVVGAIVMVSRRRRRYPALQPLPGRGPPGYGNGYQYADHGYGTPMQPPGAPPVPPPAPPPLTERICPRCGAVVSAAGPFCPSCGAAVPGM
jgi:hypothetical protein